MIRRQVFKLFGAAFHVYDDSGHVIGYSKQKAFKLREDIRLFTDEGMSRELLSIQARNIIDFSAAYDIVDGQTGEHVGTARRKGWSSIFRDAWELLDAAGHPVAKVDEDSAFMALLRRFLSNLIPQNFDVHTPDGRRHADLGQSFNPFIYKLNVSLDAGCTLDARLVFGVAVLIAAIEGRQN